MSFLVSLRGHPLLLQRLPRAGEAPVVTAECYEKWYTLYLVRPGVEVEEVPFPESTTLTPYIDHVPNPIVVQQWAKEHGYELDELTLEMMIGRWQLARSGSPSGADLDCGREDG